MTRKKRWLGALAVCLLLPVAGVVAAITLIRPDDFKPALIDAVQHATGRTLTLAGKLRVTWSLWPTLQVDGARLSNLPGGSRPDMARAERIEAQLSLPALLRRRIDVIHLLLVGPNVLFEVVGGKPNWVLTPQAGAGSPARPSAGPLRLRIDAVHVQNGLIAWRLPTRTHVVGLRSFDLHYPSSDALDGAGTLVYGDNQPFTLQFSGRATAGLYGPWQTAIDLAAYDTQAHAQGTVTLGGNYDLDLQIRSGTLDRLNALWPVMALPPVRGLALSGHVANNPVLGSLPVLGPLRLAFDAADGGRMLPGLRLGRTTLTLPAPGGAARITSAGQYRGGAVTLAGTVRVPRRLADSGAVPVDLVATAEGSRLSLAGTVRRDRQHFAGLEAAASLRAPALAALRPMLTGALPALTGLGFDGTVAVSGDMHSLRIEGGRLATDQGDVAGDGQVGFGAGGSAMQTATARLSSTRLDLDALLRAFGIEPSAPAANGRAFADRPLPWTATVGPPAMDVAINVGAATFAGQTWRSAALTLRRDRARQTASLLVAVPEDAAGTPVSISVSSAIPGASSGPTPASLSVHAPDIPLALLAHDMGLPGQVTGTAQVQAELHGTGRTLHEFAASLDGPVSITATGGEMSNAAFRQLAAGSLQPLGIKVPAQGETALRCFGLIGTAQGGLLRLRTIALVSSHLSLNGDGQVDFGRQTVALKIHPLVQVGGSPVAVPVVVGGPFDAITGRLDASGLDKVGLLIDGMFGGDAPETCSDAGLVPAQAGRRPGALPLDPAKG